MAIYLQIPAIYNTQRKLKLYKSSDIDQIPAKPIQAGANLLSSDIHRLINYIWNKVELAQH
jgi:hypothetical protein